MARTTSLPTARDLACAVSNGLVPTLEAPRGGADADAYEIRFPDLFREGTGLAFPCDSRGCVDLDGLSDRARDNYLFARAMIGRDFALPVVRARALH
jgi:hypothetical protein